MSMDLKSRTEQSAGIPVQCVHVPEPHLELCLKNTAKREGGRAMKCAQKSEKTNSKTAFPPFSSSMKVSMENSFQRGSLVGVTGTHLGFYSPRGIFVSVGKHLVLTLDVEQHKL